MSTLGGVCLRTRGEQEADGTLDGPGKVAPGLVGLAAPLEAPAALVLELEQLGEAFAVKDGDRSGGGGVLALAGRRRVRKLHDLGLGGKLGRGGERVAEVLRRLTVALVERGDNLLNGPVGLKVVQAEEERREAALENESVHLRGRAGCGSALGPRAGVTLGAAYRWATVLLR